jgi:hypothetical protein
VPLVCPTISLARASDPVGPVGSSLATWAELDPTPKKNRERDLWFFGVFILRSVFLYYKNINLVLKYLIFYEMLQKYIYLKKLKKKGFCFHAYGQVSQR